MKNHTVDCCKFIVYYKEMDVVLDASAIIAVIADEPEGYEVISLTQNCSIISPNVLPFEICNSLTRMVKKGIITNKEKMIDLINSFQKIPIKLIENNLKNAIEIAWIYKIYAYDAFYIRDCKKLKYSITDI
jgi:predicted nucleic acid-binding protein